jgi:hypothetical protein
VAVTVATYYADSLEVSVAPPCAGSATPWLCHYGAYGCCWLLVMVLAAGEVGIVGVVGVFVTVVAVVASSLLSA